MCVLHIRKNMLCQLYEKIRANPSDSHIIVDDVIVSVIVINSILMERSQGSERKRLAITSYR